MEAEAKYHRLREIIGGLSSALVAFSGGVDSGLLLRATVEVLPGRTTAVFARSVLNPPGELEAARAMADSLGVDLLVIDFDPLEIEPVRTNTRDRCYYCKTALARELKAQARSLGIEHVLEGSHMDDASEYRPGARAVLEAGLKSPLKEAGLSKTEIRSLSRDLGLGNWNRPAAACLATRFPYDTILDPWALGQVSEAERLLAEFGFEGVRARHHGEILRLEPPPDLMSPLMSEESRSRLVEELGRLGFKFVTVDLAGYRTGVFDG